MHAIPLVGAVIAGVLFPGAPTTNSPLDRHATAIPAVRSVPTDRIAAPVGDPKAIKVIGIWLKEYRRGKWDLTVRGNRGGARRDMEKDSLIAKHKLIPADFLGMMSYEIEIDLLCRQAREVETADAARAILEVAAVGLDTRVKYLGTMAPTTVRGVGETHLRKFTGKAAIDYLATAAAGSPGGSRAFATAMQAAALRALGSRQSSAHRQVMIDQLAANDIQVRSAAAYALGRLGEAYSIKPLAERLAREGDPATIIEIVTAIDLIRSAKTERDVKLEHMQMAVIEIGRALGRTDSWRPDLAIVDFLEKYRYKDSIPVLIAFLERYVTDTHKVKSGRLSGRLRIRVHEALLSLTGTRIPMTAPDKWREFWTKNAATFQVAKMSTDTNQPSDKGTSGGFFNIPVQGKRVVFVIDVSNSMNWPMNAKATGRTVAGGRRSDASTHKITIAKRELWQAVEGLPSDARFNVIFYNHEVGQWSNKLMAASNGNKARFKRWLDSQRASGNTNIYDAMKLALKIKSLVYGHHYDSNVDEMFLLSDGVPNTGEVTNPSEILRIITETNRFSRVRINTVYLEDAGRGVGGRMPGGSGAGLMQQLAAKNGGRFVKP